MSAPCIEYRKSKSHPWELWAQWPGRRKEGIESALRLLVHLRVDQGFKNAVVTFGGKTVELERKKKGDTSS